VDQNTLSAVHIVQTQANKRTCHCCPTKATDKLPSHALENDTTRKRFGLLTVHSFKV